MATVTLIAVGALALLTALLFAALVELYRDVRQLRDAAGILDRPLTLDVSAVAGAPPGRYGLPRELDTASAALVLFLSDRCATCRSLAASFGGALPAGLWVVLEASDPAAAHAFLQSYGLGALVPTGRVTVDAGGGIARRLGLDTTPVGLRVENGVLVSGTTVPSVRYLLSVLPHSLRLRPAASTEWRQAS